jgi:hypothetical protein
VSRDIVLSNRLILSLKPNVKNIRNSFYDANNHGVFVMVKCCVLFEVQTKIINIILTSFGFKGSRVNLTVELHQVFKHHLNSLDFRQRGISVSLFLELPLQEHVASSFLVFVDVTRLIFPRYIDRYIR